MDYFLFMKKKGVCAYTQADVKMIRRFKDTDREIFIEMAEEFYSSPAVLHSIPISRHSDTFDEIIKGGCYLDGYMFEYEGQPAGFGVTAKTYSPEAGGIVIWVEDLYIRPQFRSKGLGRLLFEELERNGDPRLKRIRLEVEEGNIKAISLYKRLGFRHLPYGQMVKEL